MPDHQNLTVNGKELPSFFDSKLFNMCLVKKKTIYKSPFGPKIDKRAMMFATALYPMARKHYTLTLLLFFSGSEYKALNETFARVPQTKKRAERCQSLK